MHEEKKLLVYPYDVEFSPVIRHSGMLQSFDITVLVSPGGWGMNGKNAGTIDRGDKLNIDITNDFDAALSLCEAVLFCEAVRPLDFDTSILPKVTKAAGQGKDIMYLRKMQDEDIKTLEDICEKNSVKFMSYRDFETTYVFKDFDFFKLQKINTPVIFVAGIYERTQKFEIQLSLREALTNIGYKVSQIGSRNYCELLGFHSFPQFMYGSSLNEEKKVIAFNHLLKNIEISENPDVIIVGIPGGIMKLNDRFTSGFGILAYEISQAVAPDAAIFSTFYEDFDTGHFKKLTTSIKHKLGFDISCFNLSNTKVDWEASKTSARESYLLLDSNFIDSKKSAFDMLNTPVFNILNNGDRVNMANHLVDILSSFGEVESV